MDKLVLTAVEKEQLIGKVTEMAEKGVLNKLDMAAILEVCRDAAEREYQARLRELRAEMVIEGGKKRGEE